MLTSTGRKHLAEGIRARHQKGIVGTHFDAPEACSQRDGTWPCDSVELAEAVLASDGHELGRAIIAKHGIDRTPTIDTQALKLVEELGELVGAILKKRGFAAVRKEYGDVGLCLHNLGNKLGLDLLDCMTAVVNGETRTFDETSIYDSEKK